MESSEAYKIFRSECRNYTLYQKEREELIGKLDRVQYQINGVHSVRFEKTYQQSSRFNRSILGKVEVKSLLQTKLSAAEGKIAWIEACINAIPFPFHRVAAWRVYVMKDSFQKVARDYDVDCEHLRKTNRQFLNAVLDEKRMQQWKEADDAYAYSKTIIIRMYQNQTEEQRA